MGISNRDYYRDDPPVYSSTSFGGHTRSGGYSTVTWLIIVTAIVFVVQILARGYLEVWFGLDPARVLRGQIWRLTTYDFLHATGSPWHILFNMYILYLTGRDFEARRGSREFIAFYLIAGAISGVLFVLWALFLGNLRPAIGASGAVSAVMIVYALTQPHAIWRIWGIIPVPVMLIAILVVILDLHPMLLQLADRNYDDGVAHSAHIGGMLFAWLYFRNGWRISDWVPSGRFWKFRRRPKLRVHRPEPGDSGFDDRVDSLLDKVARHGEASLSDEERSILIEASRRARNRLSR